MKTFKQFLAEASQSQLKQWTEHLVSNDGLEEAVAKALIQYWKDTISKLPDKTIMDLIKNSNIKDVDAKKVKDVMSFIPTKRNPDPIYGFNALETIVDLHKDSKAVKGKQEVNVDENSDDIIYNKNNLIIKKGHSRNACVQHGQGYSWCISRPDASNLYTMYRYRNEATFYFVLDKDKPQNDPYHHFVIYLLPNGTYMVANAKNDGDKEMSWNEIITHQPKLKELEKLFKYHPLTNEERELYKRFKDKISDEEFLRLNLQEMEFYLSLGHKLSQDVLLQLFESKAKKQILNKYINHHWNVPKAVYDKVTPAQKKKIEQNQLAAVEQNGNLIQYIIKAGYEPSPEVQLAAVEQNGNLIEDIIDAGYEPSEAVQLAAVENKKFVIKFIKNPTPKVIQYVIDYADKGEIENYLSHMVFSQAEEKLQKAFDKKYK